VRILLGERHLRKAVKEHTDHYHIERNHQVLPLHGSTVQGHEAAWTQSVPGASPAKLAREQQGLDNELIEMPIDGPNMDGAVDCRETPGGILNYYRRRAA